MTDFDCGIEEGWHQCERHDERRPKTRGCCAGCSPKCSAAGLCPRGGLGAGGSEGKPQVERSRRGGKTRSSCDWSGGRRLAGCSQLVLLSQAEATLRQAAWLFAAVDIMMRRTPRSRDFACLPGRSGSLSERPPQTEPVTTETRLGSRTPTPILPGGMTLRLLLLAWKRCRHACLKARMGVQAGPEEAQLGLLCLGPGPVGVRGQSSAPRCRALSPHAGGRARS